MNTAKKSRKPYFQVLDIAITYDGFRYSSVLREVSDDTIDNLPKEKEYRKDKEMLGETTRYCPRKFPQSNFSTQVLSN